MRHRPNHTMVQHLLLIPPQFRYISNSANFFAFNFHTQLMSWFVAMVLTFYITRVVNGPIYRAWMSKNIKPEIRATVLSTYGQIDSLGQIIGVPLIGFIAVKTSISTAIVAAGIVLSPIIPIFICVYKKCKCKENAHCIKDHF